MQIQCGRPSLPARVVFYISPFSLTGAGECHRRTQKRWSVLFCARTRDAGDVHHVGRLVLRRMWSAGCSWRFPKAVLHALPFLAGAASFSEFGREREQGNRPAFGTDPKKIRCSPLDAPPTAPQHMPPLRRRSPRAQKDPRPAWLLSPTSLRRGCHLARLRNWDLTPLRRSSPPPRRSTSASAGMPP